jgi:hypothetical protein
MAIKGNCHCAATRFTVTKRPETVTHSLPHWADGRDTLLTQRCQQTTAIVEHDQREVATWTGMHGVSC